MTPLAPPNPLGYPAPFWVLVSLKVFGFVLHALCMNIWYAGLPLAFLLVLRGGSHGRRLARRLGMAMPIVLALGINFGIVPLLFTQVVNAQFYYAAGVLIAWPWFSIIPLLTVAYYGAYLHSRTERRQWLLASAGISALFLVLIGFLFANNLSLMTNVPQWLTIFRRTAVAGAPHGVALNLGDPTLLPRWLMMLGIAMGTTAAYVVLDAAFFARRESPEYRAWIGRIAFILSSVSLVWFAAAGSWYFFGALSPQIREQIAQRPAIAAHTIATAVSPGLPWLLTLLWWRTRRGLLAGAVVASQVIAVALNAVSRQWVQNVELSRYADLAAVPVRAQWAALALFLVLLIIAFALCIWMTTKFWRAWQADDAV